MDGHEPKIARRKADHIEVAASGRADFRRTTLLEHVHLVHEALPELRADEIDLSVELCGHTLQAPLIVTGMTGGTDEAADINRDLARAAQTLGIGFGVGSQRAMAEHPELIRTFQVRDVAPDVFLIGNLGAVQAAHYGSARVAELASAIGVSAMAIHLNPAQEMIQAEGDRDFVGAAENLGSLCKELSVPVIAKETGCGISPQAAATLAQAGVAAVDVSGAGGTSWVAVEAERAPAGSPEQRLGRELSDWGIPTAVSTAVCAAAGLEVIASGGIRSGHDIARAIALGAKVGGFAAPALRAWQAGGYQGAVDHLQSVIDSIRTIALLSACAKILDLGAKPRHLGAPLRDWLNDLGIR